MSEIRNRVCVPLILLGIVRWLAQAMIKKPHIMHIESFFQFFSCEVSFYESRLIIINCCDIYISGLVILTNYLFD